LAHYGDYGIFLGFLAIEVSWVFLTLLPAHIALVGGLKPPEKSKFYMFWVIFWVNFFNNYGR
jgi:hypothetical protein